MRKWMGKSMLVYLLWSVLCWFDPAKPGNDIRRTIETFSLIKLLTAIWH